MADIKHEVKKIEFVDTVGGFEVSYTLTNYGKNSFGVFIGSISWEMFGFHPSKWEIDVSTYVGDVELEGIEPYMFDFTKVEEKVLDAVERTMFCFIDAVESAVKDTVE